MDLNAWSARRLVGTDVTSRGITLGRPVDLLLDARLSQALGLEVLCLDGLHRFLPWRACRPSARSIEVRNPLSLLETGEADFYRREGLSLRDLQRRGVADDVDLDAEGRAVLVWLRADAAAGAGAVL
jgi:hypothetical protein